MFRKTALLLSLMFLAAIPSVHAADVYLLRFYASGAFVNACTSAFWLDRVIFNNRLQSSQVVKLVDSTSPIDPMESQVLVPPGVSDLASLPVHWRSTSIEFLGVLHLDVPDGVDVISNDLPSLLTCTGACACPPNIVTQGSTTQQVFHELVPANSPETHVGVDLPGIDSRSNVIAYNAGSEPALVTIELRQTCGDIPLATTQVIIPPRSVAVAPSLAGKGQACSQTPTFTPTSRYIRVTSTQPGLSWVSTIANDVTGPKSTLLTN